MGSHSVTPKCYRAMYIGHIYAITHLWQFPVAFSLLCHTHKSAKRNSAPTHTRSLFEFFLGEEDLQNVIHAATATNKSIFYDSLIYTQHLEEKGGNISDEWDCDGCCSNKKLCQMTQWNGKIICNHKKCEMNLIDVSFFSSCLFSVYAYSSVEFPFLDRIFPFDSTWCLLVISLITLMCRFSLHSAIFYHFFCASVLFTSDFRTLFILQTVLRHIHVVLCYVYFIYDARVFHLFNLFGLTLNKHKLWIFYEWQIKFSYQAFFVIQFWNYMWWASVRASVRMCVSFFLFSFILSWEWRIF